MITFKPSAEDIRVAAQTVANDAALAAWLGKACSYHPRDVPDHIRPPTNAMRSHAERVLFVTEPLPYGVTYGGYLAAGSDRDGDRPRITTFTGETLATVTFLRSWRVRSGLTDSRGSFHAIGIDGRAYHGRHNGVGVYCTLRLNKHQGPRKGKYMGHRVKAHHPRGGFYEGTIVKVEREEGRGLVLTLDSGATIVPSDILEWQS